MTDTALPNLIEDKKKEDKYDKDIERDTFESISDDDDDDIQMQGCGILGRYPVLSVLIFAAFGLILGIGLSFWDPIEGDDTKDIIIKWIGLLGDLFIRSLKAVVLPLVFINVMVSIVDMMSVGRAGSIGWKSILAYLITTVIASIFGIISIVSFKSLFNKGKFENILPPTIKLGCNTNNTYLTEQNDGSIVCLADSMNSSSTFIIEDLTETFVRNSGGIIDDINLSDTVYDGVFTKLITDNIMEAFTTANFAAVVFIAIIFGLALSRVLQKNGGRNKSFVMKFLVELDQVFLTCINWIIACTPFAVMSLIASAVGKQSNLSEAFENVGYLVVATLLAMAAHVLFVYILAFMLITKLNPFKYLELMIPAQTMAFACASSAATIPMSLKYVKSTGRVPDAIAKFIIPLGATVNMDGGAIYFPCCCIWLAVLNGIEPDIASYFLLVIIATIGSAGTAPVPSASLVLIITAYNTVFNTTGTPDGFSYILAIDWFMDRCRTVMNVTGDCTVCGIVSHLCPINDLKLDENATGTENNTEDN